MAAGTAQLAFVIFQLMTAARTPAPMLTRGFDWAFRGFARRLCWFFTLARHAVDL